MLFSQYWGVPGKEESFEENYPMRARILWIEGKRADSPSFSLDLRKKGYQVETVSTGKAALEHLSADGADLVVVNAAPCAPAAGVSARPALILGEARQSC
jgi:hypothetical protein